MSGGTFIERFGRYGYIRKYPLERKMRDAKLLQMVEGTNQIQRILIAGEILGWRLYSRLKAIDFN